MMISYIKIDGTQIDFINGNPPRSEKQKPRQLDKGYREEELRINEELKSRNFIYVISPVYAYVKRIIPNEYLSMKLFVGLAWFFSLQLNEPFSREYYRHKSSVIYWLQMRCIQIKQFIQEHRIILNYNNQEYHLE